MSEMTSLLTGVLEYRRIVDGSVSVQLLRQIQGAMAAAEIRKRHWRADKQYAAWAAGSTARHLKPSALKSY